MSKIYALRGERLLSLALEKKSTNSWGNYESERRSKDNSVGKYDSVKQLFTSVTEILHAYPLVSTFPTSKEVRSKKRVHLLQIIIVSTILVA